jgi:hypothetical protein
VHSYLSLADGGVRRVVDGMADPTMKRRLAGDGKYLRVDPVSSREQYRWMERFIEGIGDTETGERLAQAIDGKGAFRRFKDALMSYPEEREHWFVFRSQKLRVAIKAWLDAHDIQVVDRAAWESAGGGREAAESSERVSGGNADELDSGIQSDALISLIQGLNERELEMVRTFAEFLHDRRLRRRVPRRRSAEPVEGTEASTPLPDIEG